MWRGIQTEKTEGRIGDESQLNGLINCVDHISGYFFRIPLLWHNWACSWVRLSSLDLSSVALTLPAAFITNAGHQGYFPSGTDGVATSTNQWSGPEWLSSAPVCLHYKEVHFMWRHDQCPTPTWLANNFDAIGTKMKMDVLIWNFSCCDVCLYKHIFCKNVEFWDIVFLFHHGMKLVMGKICSQ